MGWWGYGPMDGDAALDMESDFSHAIGKQDAESRAIDNQSEVDAVVAAKADFVNHEGDESLFWQVLGAMVMKGGGPLGTIKPQVLSAIERDHWGSECGDDRQLAMQGFANQVTLYQDGHAVDVSGAGLFAAIAGHLASGKPGLVNKF